MGKISHFFAWLRRLGHARGFGIQSPTDYWFVRYVISEQWPYHAYDALPKADRLTTRLGRLYLRLANHRQPSTIIDLVGMGPYLHAGCRRAHIITAKDHLAGMGDGTVEMAVVPIDVDYKMLFDRCDDHSLVVFHDIQHAYNLWRAIENAPVARITFDLYHCGIVVFDTRRSPHHYKLNL